MTQLATLMACEEPSRKSKKRARRGTDAGYQAHKAAKQPACDECLAAHRAAAAKRKAKRYEWNRRHYRENPELYVARNLRHRHGLTLDEYDDLLAAQSGGCAICGSSDPGARGRFVVDHDHACCPGQRSCPACVRGLLCNGCNVGLGAFGDDVDRMTAAVAYLMTSREAP